MKRNKDIDGGPIAFSNANFSGFVKTRNKTCDSFSRVGR